MVEPELRALGFAARSWINSKPAGRFLRALVHEIGEDDVPGMAAEMAYRFLFAIFPLMLFLVAALGFVGDTLGANRLFDDLLRYAALFLPSQVVAVVEDYVANLLATRSSTFLTVGLFGSLWGAAGGVGTLIKGLNRAYDVERPRPFWRRQLLALITTLTVPPTALALLAVAVLGRNAAGWLEQSLGAERGFVEAVALARWPTLVLLLFVGLSLLYHVLPNNRHSYVWSLPGSAVATGGWLLLTQLFGLYVANFSHYDSTYGSFGAAIAFLLWLYLVNIVVLLGAEINALLEPDRRGDWVSGVLPDSEPIHDR